MTIVLRARGEPRAADAVGHEHVGGRTRSRVGRRPGPAPRRARRVRARGDRRARRPRRRRAHARPRTTIPRRSRRCASTRRRRSRPVAATVDVKLGEGVRFGPFEAVATPGHAADHFALIAGGACFTGDAVLGPGSVFVSPYPGAMSGYLPALERLRMRDGLRRPLPRSRPAGVGSARASSRSTSPTASTARTRLIAALGEGRRTRRRAARRGLARRAARRCARGPP